MNLRKIIIKTITIFIAFILGLVATSYLYNKGNLDMTSHMPEATLPILYFAQDGQYTNPTYGYTAGADASCMRSAVAPLNDDRILHIALEKYNAKVEAVSYEVRSMDTERLIQNGQIEQLQESGQYLSGEVKIKDLLEKGEEYLLIFHLTLDNYEDVQYFARITDSSYELVKACTEFAMEFHNATLDPNNDYPITQYLETDTTRKESSLARVDIHSRYKRLIWDGMEVKETIAPTLTYLELENDVVSLALEYQVSYQNENHEKEKYQVRDYFRVRQTNMRMYLLDYERTTERIFSPDDQVFEKNSLNLGIQWKAISYLANEEGSVVNFVVSGELWSYDIAQNKLSRVFSFKNGNDKRGLHEEFEIQMINMEDSGSMDFLVKGYMNRGRHEGETGVSVMRYNSLTNTTEELLFIESADCAGVLAQNVGALSYISYDDKMYLSHGSDISILDLKERSVETLTEDLAAGDYLISRGGDMMAWQHGEDRFASTEITTMDMKTGVRQNYVAEEGEYLRPLGFSGEDFLYGICKEEDVAEDFAGNTLFPMYRVRIVDNKGETIRDFDYLSKNKYIISAAAADNRFDLTCVTRNADGTYTEALAETITSAEAELVSSVTLSVVKDEVKKAEQVFHFDVNAGGRKKLVKPKHILFEGNRTVAFADQEDGSNYHSYGKGRILGVYTELREAVAAAYDTMGVVTGQNGEVVWQRGNRKTRSVLALADGTEPIAAQNSLEAALKLLLEEEGVYVDVQASLAQGRSAYQILKQNSHKQPENLTGCNLSSVLYYLSEGNYVLAMTDAYSAELIVGYDAQNIYVLDALTGKVRKEGQKDAMAGYEACGNVFFSYLK